MEYGIRIMSITLRDIANDAGVGMSTVSYVLSGSGVNKVGHETRKRILASAEKLGYLPNIGARGLSCGRTFMVGVLLEEQEFASSFYPDILQGLEYVLSKRDYGLLLASYSNEKELKAKCSYLLQRRVDGVAAFSGDWLVDFSSTGQPFLEKHIPIITMTRPFSGIPAVDINAFAIGEMASRYLVGLGHRKIAYAGPEISPRRAGLLSVLGTDSCPTFGKLTSYDFELGVTLFDWIRNLPERPTAVVVESDIAAVALIRTANAAGWKLPRDLSVVGIDGLDLGKISLPALTSVGQPTFERGAKTAELLLKMIDGEEVENFFFEPCMIVRESCCRVE